MASFPDSFAACNVGLGKTLEDEVPDRSRFLARPDSFFAEKFATDTE